MWFHGNWFVGTRSLFFGDLRSPIQLFRLFIVVLLIYNVIIPFFVSKKLG